MNMRLNFNIKREKSAKVKDIFRLLKVDAAEYASLPEDILSGDFTKFSVLKTDKGYKLVIIVS